MNGLMLPYNYHITNKTSVPILAHGDPIAKQEDQIANKELQDTTASWLSRPPVATFGPADEMVPCNVLHQATIMDWLLTAYMFPFMFYEQTLLKPFFLMTYLVYC